jgi:hypothetical protein
MKPWMWVALVGAGAVAAIALLKQSAANSAGSQFSQNYKGFTITCTCGALGPGCAGSWNVRNTTVGQTFVDTVQSNSGLNCLAAARAKIDAYGPDTVPA